MSSTECGAVCDGPKEDEQEEESLKKYKEYFGEFLRGMKLRGERTL